MPKSHSCRSHLDVLDDVQGIVEFLQGILPLPFEQKENLSRMNAKLATTCALIIFALFHQGVPSPDGPKPGSVAEKSTESFGNALRRTVGFLQVDYAEGIQHRSIRGTCFFVYYPDERLGPDKGFGYLVTNRHMAAPGAELNEHFSVERVFVILNSKLTGDEASAGVAGLALGNAPKWIFPEDDSVDLAILPLAPSHDRFDYLTVPVSAFATQDFVKQRSVAPGDTVAFAGYFYQWPGDKRIQPIVRQGVLAMMPDETNRHHAQSEAGESLSSGRACISWE